MLLESLGLTSNWTCDSLFYGDNDLITRNITKAKALIEQGGDWDRKNRLKVYEVSVFGAGYYRKPLT